MTDTIIKNARMLIKDKIVEVNLLIEDGRIERIARVISKIPATGAVDQIINARGDLVLPSGIDVHVHFRDLGEAHKEDWYTGSLAAARGGITTVIDHPNTQPPTLDKKSFYQKLREADAKSIIDFGINAGVSSENLEELGELWHLGASGFGEIFMAESTGKLQVDRQTLTKAIDQIRLLGAVACIHAEDETLNRELKQKHKNNKQPSVHSLIRPPESEERAVRAALELAEKETKLHFCHISTENAINKIRDAKKEGQDITCEVTPHHLFLTVKDSQRLGSYGKMNPPLRDTHHLTCLWTALNNKTIDMIASDHAPHGREEKNTNILEAPSGVPGVETLLPLMLYAAKHNRISLRRLIEVTRLNPAKRFSLPGKEELREGFDADLLIVNTREPQTVRAEHLHSKAGWTPYEHMPAFFPRLTLLRGEVIWEDGVAVRRGYGRWLTGAGFQRGAILIG
jgi:dihydroorotase